MTKFIMKVTTRIVKLMMMMTMIMIITMLLLIIMVLLMIMIMMVMAVWNGSWYEMAIRILNSTALRFFQLPCTTVLWNYYIEPEGRRMDPWERIVHSFRFERGTSFFKMLVPTVDTTRFGYLLERLLSVNRPVLYTGSTGVGKVRLRCGLINMILYLPIFLCVTTFFFLK